MSRKTFWFRTMIAVLIASAIAAVGLWVLDIPGVAVVTILAFLIIVTIWSIGRLQDIGLSGAWVFLNFLPIFRSIVVIILLVMPSGKFNKNKSQ